MEYSQRPELEAESPFSPRRLGEIATGLADQFEVLYEAKPADPRANMAGNMLTIAFQGGLSPADETHLGAGHGGELRDFRECFLEVVAEDLSTTAELLTGSHVTYFSGLFDPATRTTNMLFVLDLIADDEEEQRQAIRSWSEQVRRNARELRMSNLQTRETHVALREQIGELRVAIGGERGRSQGPEPEASEDP